MNSTKIHLMAVLGAVVVSSALASSADPKPERPPFQSKLLVRVTSEDQATKRQLESFLSRELRDLKDVSIVETGHDASLQAMAIKQVAVDNNTVLGYAVSVAATKPVKLGSFRSFLTGKPPQALDTLFTLLDSMEEFSTQFLYVGSEKDLREIAERIVVDFDTTVIEPERKTDRIIREALEKAGVK